MSKFSFSDEQMYVIESALKIIKSPDEDLFEISGIAGSGKSTVFH